MTARYLCVPYQRWHLQWLYDCGPAAEGVVLPLDTEGMRDLERTNAWTLVHEGTPVACGGTVQMWEGRHVAWAYLGDDAGPHILRITRDAHKCISRATGRIEMSVRCGFEAGYRWATILGFALETPCMIAYGPQGEDHAGFVRFN